MENIVNGVGISRSLDLKTLYNSSVTNDTVSTSSKRKTRSMSDSDRLKKDKKTRKVVSLSSETDKACNVDMVLHDLEDSDEKLCDSNCLAGSMIYVPRRRRDFVGKSKFENGKESDKEELVENILDEETNGQDHLSIAEDNEIKESSSEVPLVLENGYASNQSPVNDIKQNSNSRKRKSRRVGKEAKPSVDTPRVLREDDEENLEANAARMLSSRFDPNFNKFPSIPVIPPTKCVSEETDDRTLRPRRKQEEVKGKVRKRRHFYDVLFSDVEDSHWLLNKKIKLLWPLDQKWYNGFVDGYDGDKNMHHVKYDDREEEWIDFKGESFKVLLFANEVPGGKQRKRGSSRRSKNVTVIKEEEKQKEKEKVEEDDKCMGDMDSEPIITWLAKAGQKRRKSEVAISNVTVKTEPDVVVDQCGLPGPSGSMYPIVYYRKRLHTTKKGILKGSGVEVLKQLHASKCPDPDVEFIPFEDCVPTELYCPWNDDIEQFELSVSLTMNYFDMASVDWIPRLAPLMTLWPRVCLEMIFLNNRDGLRYMIFEGCLMDIVQLVFRILTVVDHSDKQETELPVFSVGFLVSGFQRKSFYSFQEVKDSKLSYLEQNVSRHCLLVKHITASECTHDYMNALQKVMKKRSRFGIRSDIVLRGSQPSTLLLSLHLAMMRELGDDDDKERYVEKKHDLVIDGACDMVDEPSEPSKGQNDEPIREQETKELKDIHTQIQQPVSNPEHCTTPSSSQIQNDSPIKEQEAKELKDFHTPSQIQQPVSNPGQCITPNSSIVRHKHETRSTVSIQAPITEDSNSLAVTIQSPKATAPRSMWQRSKSSLTGGWSGNGPKKRRTQVSYLLPSSGGSDSNKNKGLPNKRIRRSTSAVTDVTKGLNLESSFCDGNVLVTLGDRGWREYGAQVFLEPSDINNEWKLAVKFSGTTRYSHRVRQFLQPGSTNRFTLAMMWKGGKDWTLEFPDRGQWALFKEMHEECLDRNNRAALVRNIPIPGIRMIEKDGFDTETEYNNNSLKFYRQIETDVEMALNPLRVLYDMDSDDEECLARIGNLTEEMFEKAMDMLEKASYVKQRDHFTLTEVQELMSGVGLMEGMETIYEHWRVKRQKKGMPLIRHLQPPLWEKYQREVIEWELVKSKANTQSSSSSQPIEKPAMFAFCFKPRGLEVKHRGTKHRSHKKITVYAQPTTPSGGDYDVYGRRSGGFISGDEHEVPISYSPHDVLGMGYFSNGGNGYHRNHHRKKFQRINGKRNTSDFINGSQRVDVEELHEEYKLRDAANAARRACALAKDKRERAERLRFRADLAIQKAAVAIMYADAVKGCSSTVDQSSGSSNGLGSSSEGG